MPTRNHGETLVEPIHDVVCNANHINSSIKPFAVSIQKDAAFFSELIEVKIRFHISEFY